MQYGLTKEVIQSGDLRVMLALEPDGTEKKQLFETSRRLDDLIVVRDGKRPTLSYNKEALQRYEELMNRIQACQPFWKNGRHCSGALGYYRRGTCVIAGTSGSLDIDFLDKARENGLPIIGLGNICYAYKELTMWVGAQDVLSYLPYPIESQRVQAFVCKNQLTEGLWDPINKKQVSITPGEAVNTIGFELVSTPIEEWLENPCVVTNMGFESSVTAAICIAVLHGFQSIVFTGVSFGGSISDYFCFDEVPYQDLLRRKAVPYGRLRTRFDEIYQACARYGIRLAAVGEMPVNIPMFPPGYMSKALRSVLSLSRRVDPKKIKVTVPAESKRRYLKLVSEYKDKMITPGVVLDQAEELIKRVPDRFDNDTVKSALRRYREAVQKGGCSSCQKNGQGKPLYQVFEAGVKAKDPVLLQAWKDLLPEHYILKTELLKGTVLTDLIFRDDHSEEEQRWKDAQL